MSKFKFFDFNKRKHQVWVKPEDQDNARVNAHKSRPIRSRTPCPFCGRLFASRKLAAHKLEHK